MAETQADAPAADDRRYTAPEQGVPLVRRFAAAPRRVVMSKFGSGREGPNMASGVCLFEPVSRTIDDYL
jgi:hypothetical protein